MLPHAVGLISHAGAIPRTGPQAPGYSGATMVIGCIMKFAASYGLVGETAWPCLASMPAGTIPRTGPYDAGFIAWCYMVIFAGILKMAGAIPRTGPQAPGYSGATMVIGCIMKFAASYGLVGETAWPCLASMPAGTIPRTGPYDAGFIIWCYMVISAGILNGVKGHHPKNWGPPPPLHLSGDAGARALCAKGTIP